MDAATIAALIGAGGLTVLAPQIFTGIRGLIDGRHQREKAEAVDALSQRDAAVRLAVVEAVARVTGLGADRISVLKMK